MGQDETHYLIEDCASERNNLGILVPFCKRHQYINTMVFLFRKNPADLNIKETKMNCWVLSKNLKTQKELL